MSKYFALSHVPLEVDEKDVRRAFESKNIFLYKGSLYKYKHEVVGFVYPGPGVNIEIIDGFKFNKSCKGLVFNYSSAEYYQFIKVSARQGFVFDKERKKRKIK